MIAFTCKRKNRRKFWDRLGNFGLASIPVVGFVLFGFIPMVLSLVVSFTSVKSSMLIEGLHLPDKGFFGNYIKLFTDKAYGYNRFFRSIGNTLLYCLNIPFSLALGLFVAYSVNKVKIGKRFFRTVFFIPYVCSTAAVSLAWKMMYERHHGIFNVVLNGFGVSNVPWINSPKLFMLSTIIMSIWGGSGFCIILYQAALANVNHSLIEAARIDGASESKIFFSIILPAISPTTFYLLVIKLINSLQVMAQPEILAAGAGQGTTMLDNADLTIVRYLYAMGWGGWSNSGIGMASACGWLLAILIFIVTRINFRLRDKWVCSDMA